MPQNTFNFAKDNSESVSQQQMIMWNMLGGNTAGNYKMKPIMIYSFKNSYAFKEYINELLSVHGYNYMNSMMSIATFKDYHLTRLTNKLEIYSENKEPSKTSSWTMDRLSLPSFMVSILTLWSTGNSFCHSVPHHWCNVIQMFKSHCFKNSWVDLSKICDLSKVELQKAADAPDLSNEK